MSSAVIVPMGLEPWRLGAPEFRVQIMDREAAEKRWTYFDNAASAQAFAAEHKLYGAPCVVESRDMQVTHEVSKFAMAGDYTFWTKRFGNYESASDEFERGKLHAQRCGGGFRLVDVATGKRISFENWVD